MPRRSSTRARAVARRWRSSGAMGPRITQLAGRLLLQGEDLAITAEGLDGGVGGRGDRHGVALGQDAADPAPGAVGEGEQDTHLALLGGIEADPVRERIGVTAGEADAVGA